MALSDYTEEIRQVKRNLYTAICIHQSRERLSRSPVNEILENILTDLRTELRSYEDILISYVYETGGLQACTEFMKLDRNTQPLYTEQPDACGDRSLDHIFFIGMAMLEQMDSEISGECRLYLITDDRPGRTSGIFREEEGELFINPRFAALNAEVIVVNQNRHDKKDIPV